MTRRLHRAGIVVLALRALRGAAFPLVVVVAGSSGGSAERPLGPLAFAVLGVLLAAVAGYVTWRTVRYDVSESAISLRRGVFSVRETVIPLERVQAVDTVQGPVQRLFGVTEVHVQAAGGSREGEIVLEALSSDAVAELRSRVGRAAPAGGAAEAGAPAAVVVRRLTGRELLVTALTAGQLGVILPLLAGATQLVDDVVGDDPEQLLEQIGLVPDTPAEIGLVLLALLLVAWALSIAGAVVAFSGFSVTRDGDRLLIARGLLARREASVPVGRVQAVTILEGVLRQPFGLAALRVETAGYAAEASAAQTLFPLVRRAEVEPLLAELLGDLADDGGRLAGPPARARRRYLTGPALLALAVVAALAATGQWWWIAVPPLLAALKATLDFRAAGWRLEGDRVVLRSRRLARRTVIVPRRRVQRHELRENPLQRRARLADLSLLAGAGTRARVRHLDATVARGVFEAI